MAELDDVFDDPEHGERGRDRFAVHGIWEGVLLVAAIIIAFALHQRSASALATPAIKTMMISALAFGLLGLGAGLTLRAGAVNLALGPIMVGSTLYFGQHAGDKGVYVSAGIALAVAIGIGAALAVVVVGLHVPGWAASLGAFVCLQAWLVHLPTQVAPTGGPDIHGQIYYWFAGFAIIAIGGAAVGAIHPVRRAVGRFRSITDPAVRRGVPAAGATAGAIVVSSILACLAGIVLALGEGGFVSSNGLSFSAVAVAVALLGGTSAFGRRGGVAGTVLAAVLFTLVTFYINASNWRIDPNLVLGGALIIGVAVTRLIESYGRPRRGGDFDNSTSGWLGGTRWSSDGDTRPEVARSGSTEPDWLGADGWGR